MPDAEPTPENVMDKILHAMNHKDKEVLYKYIRRGGYYQLAKKLKQAIDEGW